MSEHVVPVAGATAGAAAGAAGAPPAPTDRSTLAEALRWPAAAACLGAAVIHFTVAPAHLDENGLHGAFFLSVGWAQLAIAFALARWPAVRTTWAAAAAVDAAVVAVWVLTRTAGLPGEDPEAVGFPDLLATVLEVGVVLAALAALRPAVARRPAPRLHPVLAGVAAVALIGVVSASVTSVTDDHAHAGDGHAHGADAEAAAGDGHAHGGPAAGGQVARSERCDLAFNTAAFNDVSVPGVPHVHDDGTPVDFTLDEWAEVFVDPADGIPPEVVVDFIEERPMMRDGILSGGLTHTLEPDPWNPMADEDECEALAGELRRAKQVAATYPTVADAEAAGYRKVTTYYPGIAAHYMHFGYVDGEFDLEHPEMLLYDGDGPTAGVVGLSYYILHEGDDEPTDGFTGDNDHYHRHVGLCIRGGVVAGGSSTSAEDCAAAGGEKADGQAGWMSHVWIAPGCESDWGVFSGANPSLTVRGLDTSSAVPAGCGTGRTIADDLDFDAGGDGPTV